MIKMVYQTFRTKEITVYKGLSLVCYRSMEIAKFYWLFVYLSQRSSSLLDFLGSMSIQRNTEYPLSKSL